MGLGILIRHFTVISKMRVAYYFSDYPHCNLTDLKSFKRCSKDDDHVVATLMFELMFEAIQFIGMRKSNNSRNENEDEVQLSFIMKATVFPRIIPLKTSHNTKKILSKIDKFSITV